MSSDEAAGDAEDLEHSTFMILPASSKSFPFAPSWSSGLVAYRLSELVVCRTEVIPIDWAEDKFI
jgi:hypothetical protein